MGLKENCIIYKQGDYSKQSYESFYLLYTPLIKSDASILYGTLSSLEQRSLSFQKLLMLVSWHKNRFESARKILEQFELLKTYYKQEEDQWIFEIKTPLNIYQFLRHDTFSRLFLNECGSSCFDMIKKIFFEPIDKKGYIDVSEKMDLSRLDSWTDKKEESLSKLQPKEEIQIYDFDFDTFLNGAQRIFPTRFRTKENLSRIAKMASVYGISALDMRKYVSRSINPNTKVFDFEKLKRQVYANRSIAKPSDDPYQLAPVKFLMNKQKGAPVSLADKKMIEKICNDYHFPNEVMNVLIEYCLNQTNQQFQKAYVEKVAASWIRLSIDTKEKAWDQIKKTNKDSTKPGEKSLPKWYAKTSQSKPDDDLLKEALELQKQLKGES